MKHKKQEVSNSTGLLRRQKRQVRREHQAENKKKKQKKQAAEKARKAIELNTFTAYEQKERRPSLLWLGGMSSAFQRCEVIPSIEGGTPVLSILAQQPYQWPENPTDFE